MTAVHHENESTGSCDPAKNRQDSPEQLIRKHQAGIWRYLRFLGAEADRVDDLVQETFLAVLRSEKAGKFTQRSPGETVAYLRQVARNRLVDVRRRDGRAPETVAVEAAESVWANVATEDGLEDYLAALRDCLSPLTERAQKALRLFYEKRHSRDAVAEQLDMKPDGIKTLLRRSRKSLRECIERKVKS